MNRRGHKNFASNVIMNLIKIKIKNIAYFVSLNVMFAVSFQLKMKIKLVTSA